MEPNQLFEKYPKIFIKSELISFECPSGWMPLIDSLCGCIQSYIDNGNTTQVVCKQVKEKFGELRFYKSGGDEIVSGMVEMTVYLAKI